MSLFKRSNTLEKPGANATKFKRSVLVVDDEEPVRAGICKALTKAGYEVVDAESGPDAIVKLTQEHFDAVVSDIRMPEMSGLDLIHVLRKLCDDTTVVVLLTAVPDPDGSLQTLATKAGVFAYLNKPCKLQEIVGTLEAGFAQHKGASVPAYTETVQSAPSEAPRPTPEPDTPPQATPQAEGERESVTRADTETKAEPEIASDPQTKAEPQGQAQQPAESVPADEGTAQIGQSSPPEEHSGSAPQPPETQGETAGKYRILVVDEESAARSALCQALEKAEFHVEATANPEDLINRLNNSSFHVMVIDLKVQGFDGFKLIKEMSAKYPETPVVVLTNVGRTEDDLQDRAMEAGAADFIAKPCKIKGLVASLKALCPPETSFWEE